MPGLLKGLATTARTLARPSHTAEYPDAQPHLPPRTRGVIALLEENCTSCMLCARECPDWCIYIDSHKETIPATTPRAGASASATCSTGSPSTSRCACTAASASRSARSTRCTGARSSSTPSSTSATCCTRRTGSASGCPPCRRRPRSTRARPSRPRSPPPTSPPGRGPPARRSGASGPRRARASRDRRAERADRPGPRRHRAAAAQTGHNRLRIESEAGGVTTLDIAFAAIGLVAAASALLAVTTRHVVHAALWLVVCLGAVAGCYLVLGAELVALVQLLVYVGAVVVLVLFALMLTRAPIGPQRRAHHRRGAPRRWPRSWPRPSPRCSPCCCVAGSAGRRSAGTDGSTGASPTQLFGTWVWPFEAALAAAARRPDRRLCRLPDGARRAPRVRIRGRVSGRSRAGPGRGGRAVIHLAGPYALAAVLAGAGHLRRPRPAQRRARAHRRRADPQRGQRPPRATVGSIGADPLRSRARPDAVRHHHRRRRDLRRARRGPGDLPAAAATSTSAARQPCPPPEQTEPAAGEPLTAMHR